MFANRLFQARHGALALTLLLLVACNAYLWLFIPYAAYDFNWRPDHRMQIVSLAADSIAAPYLAPGDQIRAVDGRPVRRSSVFFPPTARQTTYLLTVERGGDTFDVAVPYLETPDTNAIALRAVGGVLSLSFWLVGALVLRYAWRKHAQAIFLGYIFLMTAVVIISWNSTLMGVPLTWITSQPLLFAVAAAWIYLGLLSMPVPPAPRARTALGALILLAAGLGLLALAEGAVLFPRDTSVEALTGISVYKACAAALGVSGLALVCLLAIRRLRTQAIYLRQQLNILLVFVAIGVLPAVLLTFVPLAVWDAPILSVPLAMVGLIAVPIGYFYAIFRTTYLDLDGKFGRAVPAVLLILLFTAAYGLGLRALEEQYGESRSLILPAVLLFAAMTAVMPRLSAWFETGIHDLFHGRAPDKSTQIHALAHNLAYQPDLDNLQHNVAEICALLDIPTAALSVRGGNRLLTPDVQIGKLTWCEQATRSWIIDCTLVRAVQEREGTLHSLFTQLAWAEVALPLRVREQTIGVWVVARPRGRYYDQETVTFLEQAASALALGSEIILLLDSAESLSRELMDIQDEERRAVASQLHDQPLQRLTAARMQLTHILEEVGVTDEAVRARLRRLAADLATLNTELRNIYEAVFPKIIEYGIDMSLRALAEQFRFEHDLVITLDVDDLTVAEESADTRLGRVTYRIVFEALNNVVKHSGADAVEIGARCRNGVFAVTVTDNGHKQPPIALSTAQLLRDRHFGIAGMKAWAKSIDGHLRILSTPRGTQVAFEAPLRA